MDLLTVYIIALALAVDAFAVALATGVCLPVVGFRHTFRLGWHFGLFQGGMAIIGWSLGLTFRSLIEHFDHWLAFAFLAAVGLKMIFESFSKDDTCERTADPTRGASLIILSVATSIDALAVGLSFSLLGTSIWLPALIIGVVATLLTIFGLHLGKIIRGAAKLGHFAEGFGGFVLIGIGIKILHDHGVF
ncbi:MAG: manganese efflux pump MntP family protein [Proteobacteria bacterium]|nr:manganese efflux pump MntP family protein [Pseudomonadota bacterium]MBU1738260.1 manganese efflux pump MntP family protein [Pseudomonadota bacterium]